MRSFDIEEASTQLVQLVERVRQGEGCFITMAGKPVVRVTSIERPEPEHLRRLGFLDGQFSVPEDFDRMSVWDTFSQFDSSQGIP
ncbi:MULTISPECIES: type II toxin-antitoxin system prevent-host-death family antitoxin [unclassified Halomonas]|uniref:Type II toxin-antitoxin system prevent-host-death family antitoxin n=1 Tax=Halomonas sp. RT37 TaxID=2950872 RepID=A0AAU7KFH4_9GAMM|nr:MULTISPECIES: type II toxin-antitoxin system prevent-host-death family antitoxin [unclassified Halomonas]MBR9771564.1 type II toxin-antitoxin system prevent-host-death family antitoxin [Gammaproteobacteria bacterium]KJZ14381.1 hypothetical protein TW86_10165 [Halomonas sp. S2151]MBR9879471.1 type II toxin-antitoxin system prevent-host-death family antitoxin [Gammaproteobacteria bacterium]MBY6110162.1 type II toxin-antitoxin system prevent-host-death family antitoxin [Halomonas sp. DP1Y21-3]